MGAIALDLAAITATQRPAGPTRHGLVKRIWMLLYAEGGWWTSRELSASLAMGARPLDCILREMAARGFIARQHMSAEELSRQPISSRPGVRAFVQYGVSRKCKVPRDVTIEEMWDVLQGQTPRNS